MSARAPLGRTELLRLEEMSGPQGGAAVYLQPGQIVVAAQDCRVTTILGSCVAVSLHDPARSIGGINHYLLPRGASDSESARFGAIALPRLLRELLALGAAKQDLLAKVFGGASVLEGASGGLGRTNVDAALSFLDGEGIPVVARHTGGTRGRKLILQTSTGVVWLKTL
jgi:chemotaxis receptor (MCP) glutamine deamidase CheD